MGRRGRRAWSFTWATRIFSIFALRIMECHGRKTIRGATVLDVNKTTCISCFCVLQVLVIAHAPLYASNPWWLPETRATNLVEIGPSAWTALQLPLACWFLVPDIGTPSVRRLWRCNQLSWPSLIFQNARRIVPNTDPEHPNMENLNSAYITCSPALVATSAASRVFYL